MKTMLTVLALALAAQDGGFVVDNYGVWPPAVPPGGIVIEDGNVDAFRSRDGWGHGDMMEFDVGPMKGTPPDNYWDTEPRRAGRTLIVQGDAEQAFERDPDIFSPGVSVYKITIDDCWKGRVASARWAVGSLVEIGDDASLISAGSIRIQVPACNFDEMWTAETFPITDVWCDAGIRPVHVLRWDALWICRLDAEAEEP